MFGLKVDAPPKSISSNELYLLASLTRSPDPLGGRVGDDFIVVFGGGFSRGVLEDAGPGFSFEIGGGAGAELLEPRAPRCEPAAAGGCGRSPLATWALSPSTSVCAAAVADAGLVAAEGGWRH